MELLLFDACLKVSFESQELIDSKVFLSASQPGLGPWNEFGAQT